MNRCVLLFITYFFSSLLFANNVLNVYVWGGIIPKSVIRAFEKETGIHVNFSTYDSNETLFAKLRASPKPIYDIILPSAYYVERMKRQGMLSALKHAQLPNLKHLSKHFSDNDYDPLNHYSVPLVWGATGIFYNQHWIKTPPASWMDLWNPQWKNQLLLLDDSREVFALSLISLHRSPNEKRLPSLREAFLHLKHLTTNIKLFASESIQALLIDEDALIGSVWNGDAYKAHQENPAIQFVYPTEGFVVWVDCLAIPAHAPHPKEALAFINFLLNPNVAAMIATSEGHAITNRSGIALLPKHIRNNPMIYPSDETLKRSHVQQDVGDHAIRVYNQYWQALKLSF
jgi:spermidine/putrescine transport system substrate-binding protein